MKRFALLLLVVSITALLRAGAPVPDALEAQVANLIDGPQVTVVHFWAPWC